MIKSDTLCPPLPYNQGIKAFVSWRILDQLNELHRNWKTLKEEIVVETPHGNVKLYKTHDENGTTRVYLEFPRKLYLARVEGWDEIYRTFEHMVSYMSGRYSLKHGVIDWLKIWDRNQSCTSIEDYLDRVFYNMGGIIEERKNRIAHWNECAEKDIKNRQYLEEQRDKEAQIHLKYGRNFISWFIGFADAARKNGYEELAKKAISYASEVVEKYGENLNDMKQMLENLNY